MIRSPIIDPKVCKYMSENAIRMTPVQKKLIDCTMAMGNNEAKLCGSPDVVQLLQLMIKSCNVKRMVEVGCLTGVTTIGCALALPADGQIITIDLNEKGINQCRNIWKESGVDHKIQIRLGDAGPTLDQMISQGESGKIDMVIIDADHKHIINNVEKAMKLVKLGGIIAIIGTLWNGTVTNDMTHEEETSAIRELNKRLKDDKRVEISMLPMGDGVTLCLRKE